MRIIDRVEINYFRSVYSANLNKTSDINVFVGTNDAGKSNLLKALNLFFNNHSELNSEFSFAQDLCRFRAEEARAAKGRATIWIRVTFNNFLGWRSLPDKFSIKRSWNRYSSNPTDVFPNDVPNTTIGRFLSGLAFHYIPAVRSREIFSHYLEGLHDALMEDEQAGVRDSANDLLAVINANTEDMTDRILNGLGLDSKIQVPENLKELFYALDFSTDFSGHEIPLQFRGDGIQARHIPFILDFLARHSKKHHIWAYEEPENSLEMSKAYELSRQFHDEFSEQNQIFLSTHSPAFYDLTGANVTRWIVQSEEAGPNEQTVTAISNLSETDSADSALGMTAVIAERAREVYEQNEKLQEGIAELRTAVEASELPLVVVEGPTDKVVLDSAIEKLFPDENAFCEVVAGEGVSQLAGFVNTVTRMQKPLSTATIALMDNDQAGRKEFRQFVKYKVAENTNALKVVNAVNKVFVGLLPIPEPLMETIDELRNHVGDDFAPVAIEFMFPSETIAAALADEVLILEDRILRARDGELDFKVNATQNLSRHLPDELQYLVKTVANDCKAQFAIWVSDRPANEFEAFRGILTDIRTVLEA